MTYCSSWLYGIPYLSCSLGMNTHYGCTTILNNSHIFEKFDYLWINASWRLFNPYIFIIIITSYSMHGDSNEQHGCHASDIAYVCQVVITYHVHYMHFHINHIHLNTYIRRRKGSMYASSNQAIKQSNNQKNPTKIY